MTTRPHTPAAVNMIGGWLGRPLPPIPKHRSASRAGYRKTTRRRERPPAGGQNGRP